MIDRFLAVFPSIAHRLGIRGRILPADHSMRRTLQTALTAGILIAAAVVRLIALTEIGFNSDEAVYSGQAAAIAQIRNLVVEQSEALVERLAKAGFLALEHFGHQRRSAR